MIMTRERSLLR